MLKNNAGAANKSIRTNRNGVLGKIFFPLWMQLVWSEQEFKIMNYGIC